MLYLYTVLHERTVIAALKTALTEVPAASAKLTTKEAVAEIAGEVRGLRARRYAWEQITALLAERGLRLSRWTLARYLRGSPGSRRRRKVEARVGGAATVTEDSAVLARRPPDGMPSARQPRAPSVVVQETKVDPGRRPLGLPVRNVGIEDL